MGDIVRRVDAKGRVQYYIRYRDVDGRRKQRASRQPTRELAKKLLVEVEARVNRQRVGMPEASAGAATVADLIKRFLHEHTPRVKDLDLYRYQMSLCLNRVLPTLGRKLAEQLSRQDLDAARSSLCRRYKPNTTRATLQALSAVMTWAVRVEALSRNPASGLAMPQAEHSLEYLSQEHAAALLKAAERMARNKGSLIRWSRFVAIVLCLRCGLRRGEAFGLRWQDIDLNSRRLTVARSFATTPKSGKPRHLPLPATVAELLAEWRPRCPQTHENLVCPVLYRSRWGMTARLGEQAIRNVFAAAGCPRPSRPWHILRHTFASTFVMQGGSLLALQRILGHSDFKTTQIYAHLAPDYLAAEMERVKF